MPKRRGVGRDGIGFDAAARHIRALEHSRLTAAELSWQIRNTDCRHADHVCPRRNARLSHRYQCRCA